MMRPLHRQRKTLGMVIMKGWSCDSSWEGSPFYHRGLSGPGLRHGGSCATEAVLWELLQE